MIGSGRTSLDLALVGINDWRNHAICAQVSSNFEWIGIVEITGSTMVIRMQIGLKSTR